MTSCVVGRAAGLAAAMGVGALLTLGAPAAWADDDAGSDSAGSPSATSSQQQDRSTESAPARPNPAGSDDPGSDEQGSDKQGSDKQGSDGQGSDEEQESPPADGPATTSDADDHASDAHSDSREDASQDDDSVAAVSVESATVSSVPDDDPRREGGSAWSPITWVFTAAARREVADADAARISEPAAVADPGAPASNTSTSLPIDETRELVTTVDGDWETGFTTTAAVMNPATGATIGTPVTLSGSSWGAQLSDDRTHVVVAAADLVPNVGPVTSVAVISTITGMQMGRNYSVDGDPAGATPELLSADGTVVLLTTVVRDPRTSAVRTRVIVVDIAHNSQVGDTIDIAGEPAGPTVVTTGGTRAVVATFLQDSTTHRSWTKIATVDTSTGRQLGTTRTLAGGTSAGPTVLDEETVRIRTTTGLQATVNTITGATSVRPIAFPWGLDVSAFLYTPVGQVIGAAVISIYLVTSTILVYGIVAPVVNVYNWVATLVGAPVI